MSGCPWPHGTKLHVCDPHSCRYSPRQKYLRAVRQAVAELREKHGMRQVQSSLAEQAGDCAAVVETLGYYDLADFLNHMSVDQI